MRKLSANYIFDGYNLQRNKILIFDENKTLIDIIDFKNEVENTEFYNGILCPGFINAHTHIELSFLKNKLKSNTGLDGFIKQMQKVDRSYNVEKLEKIVNADNVMYKEGVSVCADIANNSITSRIKKESQIFYYTFVELFSPANNDETLTYENGLNILKSFKNTSITPHAVYSVSNSLLQMIVANISSNDILSVHFKESKQEKVLYYFYQPESKQIENPHLNFISFFPKNNNILFVHNTFIDETELDYIINNFKNAFFVICPNSNLFIDDTLPPKFLFEKAIEKICIGTDSLASNYKLSIIEELKTLSINYPSILLEQLLSMPTIQGAKALKVDNVYGSFEIGKKPGVVLIENVDLLNLRILNKSVSKRIL